MHLVYVDDSSDNADFAVMGAAIIREDDFHIIESWLANAVLLLVPEELRPTFEFHASALFNGKPPFDKIARETRLNLIERVVAVMGGDEGNYFVYGAVDLRALRRSKYSTARPQDVAFRICLDGIKDWFDKQPDKSGMMGLMICDDMSNAGLKKDLQQTYRAYRGKLGTHFTMDKLADYVHDDMYFGDSSYSTGLQVADICTYIVLRHLQNKEDTEFLYKIMEPHVFFGRLDAPA